MAKKFLIYSLMYLASFVLGFILIVVVVFPGSLACWVAFELTPEQWHAVLALVLFSFIVPGTWLKLKSNKNGKRNSAGARR